jgi:ATP-binding cassette, subfamily B, bacterial
VSQKSEFTVQNAYPYNQSSPWRWIISHIWRYKTFAIASLMLYIVSHVSYSQSPVLIGQAAEAILNGADLSVLLRLAIFIFGVLTLDGICNLLGSFSAENIAARFEADAREELYVSLLGKSQTFHDRQRVGDIMARATDDVSQLGSMVVPGFTLIFETLLAIIVPLAYIALIEFQLLLVPVLFIVVYVFAVRSYTRQLNPVTRNQRMQFGMMNAALEETVSGIEVVKASAQEVFERRKFRDNARLFRDYFVQQGFVEARYLPLLLFGITLGLTFLHALILYQQRAVSIADIIAVMGLMNVLRFPTFISIFTFSLVEMGVAGSERILPINGHIVFENVTFGYEENPLLKDISFEVEPGKTVAIVGQTGSGKSTLTQLINRTYDATHGRILIDGVDVREWDLTALRSQISKIEQDIFLFSRSIAENIAFGAPDATQEQIEQAAKEAQAHEFILSFAEGYQTKVGERGVTLSGGQRQRIALARAFLSNPRILILDDSTSAIDSATEDEIQKAIRRAQQGRTTLLITHRLSQIRWADYILVLDRGQVVACGTHDELLRRSPDYRRIFARYDVELPPLEAIEPQTA